MVHITYTLQHMPFELMYALCDVCTICSEVLHYKFCMMYFCCHSCVSTVLTFVVKDLGRLMARYCVAFESMKRFLSFKGKETLADLVSEITCT